MITTYDKLDTLGRERLSTNFFMRDFLYSEIAAWHGLRNVPEKRNLAIANGKRLCEELLEPLQATFGRIHIRSGYRSPTVNAFGCEHKLNCASNEANFAGHIWDHPDANGHGAMTCIQLPWLLDHIKRGGNWSDLAWWIHDHLPYHKLEFFKSHAFNIGWHEKPEKKITGGATYNTILTKPGMANHAGSHAHQYPGFPALIQAAT
ncbi:hypothetical protein [Fluviibacter phosphoraccumulans]|uniref:hypothetical protein n=1 Tax=Fluviibacter phosphoraccumulans TaxID=1751046 RepID=UPI0024E21E57|nr:hypothetical protein [Fluviibacter phosphoraccumulans]